MIRTVPVLPEAQMAGLMAAYDSAIAAKRRQLVLGAVLLIIAMAAASIGAELDLGKFWDNLGNFTSYFYRLLHLDSGAWVWTDPLEWYWGLSKWLWLISQTLLMAYLGTVTGAVFAVAGAFLSSQNMMHIVPVRFGMRRVLELCRTVPDIVYALVFVQAFGLGPFPGVLAIAIHTTGALGKLYAEVVESIDMRPNEGIASAGGNWFAQIRFGALPQVLSSFASYGLLRFEINVRSATVLGFVAAGGIGEELIIAIRKFYYSDVSAILLLLIVCVFAIDILSERVRHRLLSLETSR
jgi:phosphonate transport system permease protein